MIINEVDLKDREYFANFQFQLDGNDFPDDMLFYFIDDCDKNYLMAISQKHCILYSVEQQKKLLDFLINEYGKLTNVILDDMKIKFEDIGVTMFKDGILSSLLYVYYGDGEFNGYDGEAIYAQHNLNNDVNCFVGYPHMQRLDDSCSRARLYGFNLEKMNRVHIDLNYSKTKDFYQGFTFNTHERYYRREIDASTLNNGSYNGKIVKYVKAVYISPSGPKFVPFYGIYDEDELKEHLLSLGLSVDIPEILLDIYNDRVDIINVLNKILSELKEKGLILSKKNLS